MLEYVDLSEELHRVVSAHWPLRSRSLAERLINLVNKVVRRLLRWYINPIVEQQNAYNDAVARALRLLADAYLDLREDLAKLISNRTCPSCHGARLREEARHVHIGEGKQALTLHAINRLPLTQALGYFETLQLSGNKAQVAEKILKEWRESLPRFVKVMPQDYRQALRAQLMEENKDSESVAVTEEVFSKHG